MLSDDFAQYINYYFLSFTVTFVEGVDIAEKRLTGDYPFDGYNYIGFQSYDSLVSIATISKTEILLYFYNINNRNDTIGKNIREVFRLLKISSFSFSSFSSFSLFLLFLFFSFSFFAGFIFSFI